MMHTIVPHEEIWQEDDDPTQAYVEIGVNGCIMQVEPVSDYGGRVVRIISTDPQHYLDPQWQPGAGCRLR